MALTEPYKLPDPPTKGTWTEPQSGATTDNPPQYPYNHVTQSESGHSIEMDDTPNQERIRIQHGKKPSFIELQATGDVVHKIVGDGYEIIAGNKNIIISGFCNITINGDCNMHVLGDKNEKVDGDYNLIVSGEYNLRSHGEISISSDDDVSISASEEFGGSLRLSSAENLYLNGDLDVGGSITCDTISAESRVNAGMGVYAGPYGFTSALGGLSLGMPTPATPAAVPGCIFTVGTINSLVSVNAPLGNFPVATNTLILNSVWMKDIVNTAMHDYHIHKVLSKDFGITGPPNLPFI
jgi:hypothetical protein